MSDALPANCWSGCRPIPQRGVPLAPLTTWGIGGPAEWYAEPESVTALADLLSHAERHNIRSRILGGGSNLLITDAEVAGLTLHPHDGHFAAIDIDPDDARIHLGASVPLGKAAKRAEEAGLAGLEYFVGIPGTIGGAVRMNAGAGAHNLGLLVEEVGAVDHAGRFNRFKRSSLFFDYRYSSLGDLVITDVTLRLRPDATSEIRRRRKRILAERHGRQPHALRSAGCVFKNPPGDSAGRLIDAAGCKGMSQGDAMVSHQHANFLINTGSATFTDMLRLIEIVRCLVELHFDITLELEVQLWL